MDGYWILVGMMGSGKSTIGRRLAERSGRCFVDTDALIRDRFGRSITAIFAIYGESTFREHETSVLRALERQPGVISTGGGIILRDANWIELHRLGTTIFLDVNAEVIKERLTHSRKKRPLLATEDWETRVDELLAARRERYEKADLIVSLGEEDADAAADRVWEVLHAHA